MFSMWHALCIWLAVAYDPSEYRQKGWKLKIVCFGKHGTHFFKKIMYMSNTVFGVNKQSIEKDFSKQKVEMKNLKMPKLKTWSFENVYAIIIPLWASEGLRKDKCFQVRRKDVLYLLRYFKMVNHQQTES